jgi:hypothetical protein
MKFSIGDIVLLKRTGEEGRVVDFVNKEMIEVEVGGTHFPVFLDEVDHPYLKWFTDKKKAAPPAPRRNVEDLLPEPKARNIGHDVASGFHLSFLPVFRFDEFEDVVDKLKAYFINQTPYQLFLQYECLNQSGTLFTHKTELQPFSHFYLHDIPFMEMHDQPRFSYIIEEKQAKEQQARLSDTLRIRPKKLFEYISRIQRENHPMFHIRLAEDFPLPPDPFGSQKAVTESIGSIVTALKTERKEKPRPEIDLHIEELVANTKGLSNFEMLTIQMEAFEDALNEAIRNHQQSLVVIHGVGKGRLKEEIHNMLRDIPEVEFFQHDWSPRYGYGATEIFFRQ